jgi:hypothetical protein
MPKKKMSFPEVPGDTPRERFTNLVRHVISLPKSAVETKQKPKRSKNAKGAIVLSALLILSMGLFVSMLFTALRAFAQDTNQPSYQVGHYYELTLSGEPGWSTAYATQEDMTEWYQHSSTTGGGLPELDAFSKYQVKARKACDIHVHTIFQVSETRQIRSPFAALVTPYLAAEMGNITIEYIWPTSGSCAGKHWWADLTPSDAVMISH